MNSLMRWTPVGELLPRDFWNTFWDLEPEAAFGGALEPRGLQEFGWAPKVESFRKNGSYVVKADLPGVEAKDIQVTLERGCLTIRGERKVDKEVKEKDVDRREVFYGSFERTMAVPEGLKTEDIKAKYHDGVLEITLPVSEKDKPKKIKVEALEN